MGDMSGENPGVAALTSGTRVRILNCSANGCLVETRCPIPLGTIAELHVVVWDREFVDSVRVVRCDKLEDAGPVFHIGMEFLSVAPPYAASVRHVVQREHERLTGWLGPDARHD
jgi:hypothetical protein